MKEEGSEHLAKTTWETNVSAAAGRVLRVC